MLWRLQPIRVICFHETSESFDADVYCKPDWISLAQFKEQIEKLQANGYEFITLEEANRHIKKDIIRVKKYAVLTADDGLKCQLEILPWLEDNHIPLTMFLNVETLSGDKCGEQIRKYFNITTAEQERNHAVLYVDEKQIRSTKSSLLSFGYHGYDHRSAIAMSEEEFKSNVEKCKKGINAIVSAIPFYAYTYGDHYGLTDGMLREAALIPVYMDGQKNYNDASCIHRELIDKV